MRRDRADPGPRARRRRGRVPRADRPLPARAAAAHLPDRRLGAGRRGPAPGDAARRLARPRAVRGARVGAGLAVPDRHQPLARRAAGDPAPPGRPARCPRCPSRPAGASRSGSSPTPTCCSTASRTRLPGREARYETKEAIALAFIVGLQHLPPQQRAVLVLRDVLGYRAARGRRDARDQRGVGQQPAAPRACGVRVPPAGRRTRARAAPGLEARARPRRPLRRDGRERRHRRHGRAPHRRRVADDAAAPARVPGTRRDRRVPARRRAAPRRAAAAGADARQRRSPRSAATSRCPRPTSRGRSRSSC